MPGQRAKPDQIEQFLHLVSEGIAVSRASAMIGMAPNWGERYLKRMPQGAGAKKGRRELQSSTNLPKPKAFDDLRPEIQAMLAPSGFNDFCEAFLARDRTAWREEAAHVVTELLQDRSEKHYVDINTPPGIGKSTCFTHDIPLWLLCGGAYMDPGMGRAIRILLGHASKNVATHYVMRLRRILELRRPYYDKEQKREADCILTMEFGRFRPLSSEGEESVWAQDQFLVAQLLKVDLYEKEPSVQAASYKGEFIGERVDFYAWDDLTTTKTSRNPDVAEEQDRWFGDEAETRLEPGGVGLLVGQRLGPLDLHRKRLDKTWVDDEGVTHQKYVHIVFPAHHESTCDGNHRQWDLKLDGCLVDAKRLSWREILKIRNEPNFRTVYQQEDTDPETALVMPVWLDGGMDLTGFDAPGCYDRDRDFFQIPDTAPKERFINYAVVDPSASNWWAIEWWAIQTSSLNSGAGASPRDWWRYLIYGRRAKLQAGGPGGFLDWDNTQQRHVGLMEDLQLRSIEMGMPIRVWVIEANAAHRYLFQFDHFRRWRARFPNVQIIQHQTQRNKNDPELGVEARMRMPYRNGLKRLPRAPGPDALNYMKTKIHELTVWPKGDTFDTVMADWFGETNLEQIVRIGMRRGQDEQLRQQILPKQRLPKYLERQRVEVSLER